MNVYLKKNNILGAPVWTKQKNQGNSWRRGEIRIKNMKEAYQIVFEALIGSNTYNVKKIIFFFNKTKTKFQTNYFKMISLDDIRLLNDCPHKFDRFCDFETDDICNYTSLAADFKWQRASRSELQSGPLVDQ